MPLPVELEPLTDRHGQVVLQGAPDGHVLRVTLAERAESNEFAAELARRWNAHADLLAACEAALQWYEGGGKCCGGSYLAWAQQISAAIAKARGE